MDAKHLNRLVARMVSIHDTSPTPYDREEIQRLIRWDPGLFVRFRLKQNGWLAVTAVASHSAEEPCVPISTGLRTRLVGPILAGESAQRLQRKMRRLASLLSDNWSDQCRGVYEPSGRPTRSQE